MLKGKSRKAAQPATTEVKRKVARKTVKASESKGMVKKVESAETKKKESRMVPTSTEVAQTKTAGNEKKSRMPASRASEKQKKKEVTSGEDTLPDRADRSIEDNRPGLRTVYSNKTHTLLPLGFATDFTTKVQMVIFSDLATGEVHTTGLSTWKRWKLKEVKSINTET